MRLDFQFAPYLSIIKALAFVSDLYSDNWGGIADLAQHSFLFVTLFHKVLEIDDNVQNYLF